MLHVLESGAGTLPGGAVSPRKDLTAVRAADYAETSWTASGESLLVVATTVGT